MRCQYCNQELTVLRGFGNSSDTICENTACPGKFIRYKCPECKSTEKSDIQVFGIGTFEFTCKKCGHKWSSLDNN